MDVSRRRQDKLPRQGWLSFLNNYCTEYHRIATTLTCVIRRLSQCGVLLAALALPAMPAAADVQYAYDAAGRLVQVVAASGASAVYQYDSAGNITSILNLAAGQLAYVGSNASSGGAGAQITIYGSGFSTACGADAVTIGGVPATVVSCTANQLVVQVPSGATTGQISVTVAGQTVSGTQPFVVPPSPSISGFSPAIVTAGGTVTVSGTNLNPFAGRTRLTVGNYAERVSSVSASQIAFAAQASGAITVTTPYGRATSATELITVPASVDAANVIASAALTVGGTAQTLSIGQQSKYGVLSFDATSGQYLSVQLASVATVPSGSTVSYQIYSPTAALLGSGSVSASNLSIHLPQIGAAGTYVVVFASANATVQLTASLEVNTVVSVGAASQPYTTSVAGQGKRFEFSGTAGQSLGIGFTNIAPGSGGSVNLSIQVNKPDGTSLTSVTSGCNSNAPPQCNLDLMSLPQSGNYTLVVTPASQVVATFGLAITPPVTTTLSLGAPYNLSLPIPGQFGQVSFTATAGQTLALSVGSVVTNPANLSLYVTIYGPNGAMVQSTSTSSATSFNFTNLSAGIYTVTLIPQWAATTTAKITLGAGVLTTVLTDGTSASISTSVAGQNAYITFAGTAGQNLGLGFTNITPGSGSLVNLSIQVNKPDGTTLTSVSSGCNSNAPPQCNLDLMNLPQTGNYTLVISPNAQITFSVKLAISQQLTAALTAGTPYSLSLPVPGQFAQLSFTATAGQAMALNVGSVVTSPANLNLNVTIYGPNGSVVQSGSTASATTFNLTNLSAGTYTVTLIPQWAATVTAQIALGTDTVTTVPTDGTSASISTNLPGQNTYITFAGTAGQNLGLGFTNITPGSGSSVNLSIQVNKPDGTTLTSVSSGCNSSAPPQCNLDLMNLPQTGNYTLVISPNALVTFSFKLAISQQLTAALTVGTPYSLSLPTPGQFAQLSFTATAGQTLTLNVGSVATTPANLNLNVTIYGPNGSQVQTGAVSGSTTFNLANLSAGAYTIALIPQWAATVTAQISLSAGVVSTVPTDGTSSSISTSVPGQSAYITFAGTAGQNLGLGFTNIAPGSGSSVNLSIQVNKPDGTTLTSVSSGCNSSAPPQCNLDLMNLPQTGNYTLVINAGAQMTFSVNLAVSQAVTAALAAGTPYSLSLPKPGQFAQLSFAATAGQTVTLNVSSVVTTPANLSLYVTIYGPTGAQVQSGSTTSSTSFNLPNLSAGTYTATLIPQWAATTTAQVSFQ